MLSFASRSPRVYYRYARRQVTTTIGEVTTTPPLPIFSLGVFTGVLGSLVGMGGSFIALPFLTGFFRLSQHHAHGTSMAVVLATAAGGSLAYIFREGSLWERIKHIDSQNIPTMIGDVHLLTAASVALSSSMTVVLGAKFSKMASAHTLRVIMCTFLFCMAPIVPMRQQIQDFFDGGHHTKKEVTDHDSLKDLPSRMLRPLVVGAFSGLLAGMFGVGGGTVTVPSLTLFTDLDHQVALGTSLAAMLPTAIAGTIAHMRQGTMLVRTAIPLGIGCFVGSTLGGKIGKKIDDDKLKYAFSGVMLATGTHTLLRILKLVR